jgi:Tol biopolymer transport system component
VPIVVLRRLVALLVAASCAACGRAETKNTGRARSAGSTPTAVQPDAPTTAGVALPEAVRPFPIGYRGELVFQSDRNGRTKIYVLDLATGRVKAITSDNNWRDESPRWSPDGARILFKSNRAHYTGPAPETGNPDWDLYLMNADGSGVRRLTTDPGNEGDPTWAPDGRSIVFSSDADSRGDLFRLCLDDMRLERLTRHFVGRAIMPAVSPDGKTIGFAAQTLRAGEFWNYQVHLFDVPTRQSRPLATSGGACWPAWSPDGRYLVTVQLARKPSALEIRDMRTDATRMLVSDDTLWSYYPDFSRDGRHVAFSLSPAHREGEDWDLALVRTDEPGRIIRLTSGPGNDRLPDWR